VTYPDQWRENLQRTVGIEASSLQRWMAGRGIALTDGLRRLGAPVPEGDTILRARRVQHFDSKPTEYWLVVVQGSKSLGGWLLGHELDAAKESLRNIYMPPTPSPEKP
jgi:hypothetical protein